jgi:hypothetical protein
MKLRLLQDLRQVFWENLRTVAAARPKGLLTDTTLKALHELPDSPWKTIHKTTNGAREPLDSNELSTRMFEVGVEPKQLRPSPGDDMQRRGYPLAPLAAAWQRYLPPLPLDQKAVTAVTGVTREVLDAYFVWVLVDDDGKPVEPVTGVTPVTGFRPKGGGQETEVKAETEAPPATPFGGEQETAEPSATPSSGTAGAPNFVDVLSRPFDDWSPFDVSKPKNRG